MVAIVISALFISIAGRLILVPIVIIRTVIALARLLTTIVITSVIIPFLIFLRLIEASQTVLSHHVFEITTFGSTSSGFRLQCIGLYSFLIQSNYLEYPIGRNRYQIGGNRLIGRISHLTFENIGFEVIIGIHLRFQRNLSRW